MDALRTKNSVVKVTDELELPIVAPFGPAPAFEGARAADNGDKFACPHCRQFEFGNGVTLHQLIDIGFQCPLCRQQSKTPDLPPGRAIPTSSVMLPKGTYRVRTVTVPEGATLVSARAIERRLTEMGVLRPTGWIQPATWQGQLSTWVSQAEAFWREELPRLRKRARRIKVPSEHRLVWALKQVIESIESGTSVDMKAVADLVHIVSLFERWQQDPLWEKLRASVNSGKEFHHTLVQMAVVSFLADAGNGVALVPEGDSPSPDIVVALNAVKDIATEIKAPLVFNDVTSLNAKEADDTIERLYKKAKKQLRAGTSGILVVGGFHVAPDALSGLEQACHRLYSRHRAESVLGVALVSLSYVNQSLFQEGQAGTATVMAPTLTVRVASNPNYQGDASLRLALRTN